MKALLYQQLIYTSLSRLPSEWQDRSDMGHGFPSHSLSILNEAEECTMSRTKRYAKKQAKAIKRRRLNAQERQAHQQRQAQRDIEALREALDHLGLPADLVIEIEGRLRAQKRLLGKIFGLMFPTLFGCRSAHELTRVRGWDKHVPFRILGALPKRSWLKRLRQLGQDILSALWRRIEPMSDATHSRWQWTWIIDDAVFRKYGQDLELVGQWYSGQ
jgi:hypothetical protein